MKSTNKCLEWELFSKSVNSNAYHIKKVERNVDAVKVKKLGAGNIEHCVELLMNDQNRLRTDLNMIEDEMMKNIKKKKCQRTKVFKRKYSVHFVTSFRSNCFTAKAEKGTSTMTNLIRL